MTGIERRSGGLGSSTRSWWTGCLAAVVALAALVAVPAPALAATLASNVPYIGADGNAQTAPSAVVLTADDTDWTAEVSSDDTGSGSGSESGAEDESGVETKTATSGFYYVQDTVTISGAIKVTGDVSLILGDGKTLTIANGINVDAANGATLHIYAQSGGTGRISGTTNGTVGQAGIGSGTGQTAGAVTIVGGNVDVVGGSGAAGLGGGAGSIGNVTITGGTVTARGGDAAEGVTGGAGIGNGGTLPDSSLADTGKIAISDSESTVIAVGAPGAAGIGGGSGNTAQVTIEDANVTAASGTGAAAIGGGEKAIGNVTIDSARVEAISQTGVGIGSGINATSPADATLQPSVTITGTAQVSAQGAYSGIGSSPGVSSDGTLNGFAPNGKVAIGSGAGSTCSVSAVALSQESLARAITGSTTVDYRYVAFGGDTPLIPTNVIGIVGGATPDWNAYRNLRIQPVALEKVSVSPATVECPAGQSVTFKLVGEASQPAGFPTDANLAPALGATWSISGNSDPATTISADGTLTMGAAETSKDITVTATLPESVRTAWPDLATTLTATASEGAGNTGDNSGGTGDNNGNTGDNTGGTTGGTTGGSTNSGSSSSGSTSRPSSTTSSSSSSSSRPSSSSSSSSSSSGTSSSAASKLAKTGDQRLTTATTMAVASVFLAATGLTVLRRATPAQRQS